MNPFPFLEILPSLATVEIAVKPSGEIRISEIVAVGGAVLSLHRQAERG